MREKFEKLMDLYYDLKEEIKRKDKHLFERWKAGGYLIDNDIMSMYPSLEKVIDTLDEDEESDA